MLPTYIPLNKDEIGEIEKVVTNQMVGETEWDHQKLDKYFRAYIECHNNDSVKRPGVNKPILEQFLAAWSASIETACDFCGGKGHEAKECPTSIKWTREARKCGIGAQWGELKGHAYFRDKVDRWDKTQLVAYLQSKMKSGRGRRFGKFSRR